MISARRLFLGLVPGAARHKPFAVLHLALAPVILGALFLLGWLLTSGSLIQLLLYSFGFYLLFIGLWAPYRVLAAMTIELSRSAEAPSSGLVALGRIVETAALPLYCGILTLSINAMLDDALFKTPGWYFSSFLSSLLFALYGAIAIFAAAALFLVFRRRCNKVDRVAWLVGMAAAPVVFAIAISVAPPVAVEAMDGWYYFHLDLRLQWLIFVVLSLIFVIAAVNRLWQNRDGETQSPWAMAIFLLIFVGYCSGVGKLANYWLGGWLYGAFFMTRQITYIAFLLDFRRGSFIRSGWFVCYSAAIILCAVATVYQKITLSFTMPSFLLLYPRPLIAFHFVDWAFALSPALFMTRDLLFLMWWNFVRPRGWAALLGIALLVSIYVVLPPALSYYRMQFVLPIILPFYVRSLWHLVWPVATILLLAALNMKARGSDPMTVARGWHGMVRSAFSRRPRAE